MRSIRPLVVAVAVAFAAMTPTSARQGATATKPAAKAPAKHVMVAADAVKWGPPPPALPAGAEAAVLNGDPGKPGVFVIRLKMPDGYAIAPHRHPTDEHVTILSGTLMAGLGDKVDDAAMHTMAAGSYAVMPARANHYVRAKGETILQVQGTGPFEVVYVDPKDDPRKK